MKTVTLALSLLLLSLITAAQNGGQFFENNVIRLRYLGYSNGTHSITVVNKQSCQVTIRTRADQDKAVDVQVAANDSIQVQVSRPTPANVLFRAKAETSCITNPDMGWLEINTAFIPLHLNEGSSTTIVRGPNKFEASIVNGIYKSSYTNTHYIEHLTVYDIAGAVKYRSHTHAKKENVVNLNAYLQTGLNFIDILIETNRSEHVTIKYIK